MGIMREMKAIIIDELSSEFRKIFVELYDGINEEMRKPLTIDETAHLFSAAADDVILKAIHREKLTYVSGKLKIHLSEKKGYYVITMQAYFQKQSGEWVEKSTYSDNYSMRLLTPESQQELLKRKLIEFEIDEPVFETK